MIEFTLNGVDKSFRGDADTTLLHYLRKVEGITSVKDGCSGQSACGACTVEKDGKAILSCSTPMKRVGGAKVSTIEGFADNVRRTLAAAFVVKGAVQCGFCTPGLLVRTKVLLQDTPDPTRPEIVRALRTHLCRCTGYIKVFEAIELAARTLRENVDIKIENPGGVGTRQPKYDAYNRAIGKSPFVDDLAVENVLFAALKFSDFPRARVLEVDCSAAEKVDGVVRTFTADDIPGERYNGLIIPDWPVMVKEGETTRYIGDVLAGVVAETEEIARRAVKEVRVEYEELEPLTDMRAAEKSPIRVHRDGNLLEKCALRRGENADESLRNSDYVVEGSFETQRVEHAFLETEAAIARPWQKEGIELFVQSQGIYEDRKQIARILNIPEQLIKVTLVPTGGGFGGKEDITVQGHVAVFSFLLQRPIKLRLSRDESIRMHPKRHPMIMEYAVGCEKNGKLTAVKARIIGDTGAYASVGMKVLERAAGHATGAYHVPNVDIVAKTLYTNNIPCGAMRGFGVNQVTFAMESCVDELCEKGGFDRWQFRYDNALETGSKTATGQVLGPGVGVKQTLLAIKENYYGARYAGLALGIKNTGIGNGVTDFSEVKIEIEAENSVLLYHGWTEMGQGIDTIALQTLCEETGIDPGIIKIRVSTEDSARAEMTTASRATSLLGNAILDAAKQLKKDLEKTTLSELVGRVYSGRWKCDWTTVPGAQGEAVTHYSYGYAAQLVILDDNGDIETVIAAHDAGKIMNPTLFEGQIQGAVHMGLGYALSEDLPMKEGRLLSTRLNKLGILKAGDVPDIFVRGVEVRDPHGPYGAKGVGEIGLVPTAAAVANVYFRYDGIRRYKLPLQSLSVKRGSPE